MGIRYIVLIMLGVGAVVSVQGVAQLYGKSLKPSEQKRLTVTWQHRDVALFDTMLISWIASRPQKGAYHIQVRAHCCGNWSPWIDYAWWGVGEQHMFSFQLYKDMTRFLQGNKADGFGVRVYAKLGADLSEFRGIQVSTINSVEHTVLGVQEEHASCNLAVAGLSQIALPDERNTKICSPTSTTAVIRYIGDSVTIDPLCFADKVRDTRLDIYGAWALNVAQAAHELGAGWKTYVTHLSGVDELIKWLYRGYPVVVSIQGPIAGGARPYTGGHLLVVKGYNAATRQLLCMDPGFSDDQSTNVAYAEEDFVGAWRKRNGLAYIMCQVQ